MQNKKKVEDPHLTTVVAGVTLYRRKCSHCKEVIWSEHSRGIVRCEDCRVDQFPTYFSQGTGGGVRINRRTEAES